LLFAQIPHNAVIRSVSTKLDAYVKQSMASEFNSGIGCSSRDDTWLKRRISSIRTGSAPVRRAYANENTLFRPEVFVASIRNVVESLFQFTPAILLCGSGNGLGRAFARLIFRPWKSRLIFSRGMNRISIACSQLYPRMSEVPHRAFERY